MKKKTGILSLLLVILLISTSCSSDISAESSNIDAYTLELQMNDYRGGVIRTYLLKDTVLAIMDDMKRNNNVVREDNPNTYWTTNGYQDFVSTFLTSNIINDTVCFTEEETDWDTACSWMFSYSNSFTQLGKEGYEKKKNIEVYRNEKDDYSVYGVEDFIRYYYVYGNSDYRILYDCDKDWCKAYATMYISGSPSPAVTSQLFEYGRINEDTFAIQTSTERLVIVFEHSENDIDLRERSLKEFYYSRLSGGCRTKFVPRDELPIIDEETGKEIRENIQLNEKWSNYSYINEKGDLAHLYGKNDSMFLQDNINQTGYKWVFEDGALQQAIVYKEQTLVATTYNKLSEKYERFIYSVEQAKPELIAEIEKMVNIEGLIGIVEVSKSEIPTETAEADTNEGENKEDNDGKEASSLEEALSQIASDIFPEESDKTDDTEETDSPEATEVVTTTTTAEVSTLPYEASVTSAALSEEPTESTTSSTTTITVEGGLIQ